MYIPNAQIDPISLREYGRNIQNLTRRIRQEPKKEVRNAYVKSLIGLMKDLNPQLNQHHHNNIEKVWNDLFIIADYKMDVDTPCPIAAKPSAPIQPTHLSYQKKPLQYKRYGRHTLAVLEEVKKMSDKTKAETILLEVAQWLLTYYKNNVTPQYIVHYFSSILGKNALPDLNLIKEKLQTFSPSQKSGNPDQKRYFRKKRRY